MPRILYRRIPFTLTEQILLTAKSFFGLYRYPRGKTVSVHYTVKVASSVSMTSGVKINSTTATIGSKSATANSFYVGRTINSIDAQYIDMAIDALYSSSYSNLELAK